MRSNSERLIDHLVNNFDKILAFGLVLVLIGLVVHATHHQSDAELIGWGREQTGTVIGALLTLITGAAIRNRLARPRKKRK